MPITETAAEVAAIIPRYTWMLMDDVQRDDFMVNVVLSRYMVETSDGVKLGPKWWSEQTGASPSAIKERVYRLRDKASDTSGKEAVRANEDRYVRATKGVLREPETRERVFDEMSTTELIEVVNAAQKKIPKHTPTPKKRSGLDSAVSVAEMLAAIQDIEDAEPGWTADVRAGVIPEEMAVKTIQRLGIVATLMADAVQSDDFESSVPRP